jgi:hypothetical protein
MQNSLRLIQRLLNACFARIILIHLADLPHRRLCAFDGPRRRCPHILSSISIVSPPRPMNATQTPGGVLPRDTLVSLRMWVSSGSQINSRSSEVFRSSSAFFWFARSTHTRFKSVHDVHDIARYRSGRFHLRLGPLRSECFFSKAIMSSSFAGSGSDAIDGFQAFVCCLINCWIRTSAAVPRCLRNGVEVLAAAKDVAVCNPRRGRNVSPRAHENQIALESERNESASG